MSFFSPDLQTVMLFFLVVAYVFSRKTSRKSKKLSVPEPSAAWPLIGHLHLLQGQEPICKKLGEMADKCGPIYSLKLGHHRLLVVSSWEILEDCFIKNDRILATRPSIAAGKYIGYNNAIFALAPYGEYWRDIRKIATVELLSSHRLEKLKNIRFSEIDSFIKDLHAQCQNSDAVDMSKLLENMTFNINLRMIVGKRFSESCYGEESSEAGLYQRAIKQAVYLSGVFVMSDAIPYLEWLDFKGYVKSMKKTAKEIDSIISNWLEEHLIRRRNQSHGNCSATESDFMDVMLSILPEDAVMSGYTRDTVIKATALILTLTGGESTSITLTWALSLLLNHPTVLKAAHEELDSHVGREKWVKESDISNLKFLQAIVKETLRLCPPGPVTGLREATEDCYIAGHYVPKGTRLIVNIWKLQRDPRVWENPCEFRPERFMTTSADVDFKGQNFEFIPFSSGRRSCPGMNFGLRVVHLTLARLLQGFDLATFDGVPVDMREGLGLALPKLEPLQVVLAPRLPLELYQCL